MNVLDASAILAFLKGEAGAEPVRIALDAGAACSAVNWSETAQKVLGGGGSWKLVAAGLSAYRLRVEVATLEDAERAAALWGARTNLSLGDRFCLALGERLDATVWTADRAWSGLPRVKLLR